MTTVNTFVNAAKANQLNLSKYNPSSVSISATKSSAGNSVAQTAQDAASYSVDTSKVDKMTDVVSKVTLATTALTGAATLFSTVKGITDSFKSKNATANAALGQQLDAAVNAYDGSKKSAKTLSKAINKFEQTELAPLKTNYENLKAQYNELEQTLGSEDKITAKANDKIADLKTDTESKQSTLNDLASSNSDCDAGIAACDDKLTEICNNDKKMLEELNAEEEAINKPTDGLKAKYATAKEKVPTLNNALKNLETEYSAQKAALRKADEGTANYEALKDVVEKLKGQIDAKKAEITKAEEAEDAAKKALDDAEQKLKEKKANYEKNSGVKSGTIDELKKQKEAFEAKKQENNDNMKKNSRPNR